MIATRRGLFGIAAAGLVTFVAPAAFAQLVIQERPMPALRVEVMGAPPHPGWNWVRGHWKWEGVAWAWAPGHWVERAVPVMPELIVETPPPPPSTRYFWVRGHWAWEGDRWGWRRGHWVM